MQRLAAGALAAIELRSVRMGPPPHPSLPSSPAMRAALAAALAQAGLTTLPGCVRVPIAATR